MARKKKNDPEVSRETSEEKPRKLSYGEILRMKAEKAKQKFVTKTLIFIFSVIGLSAFGQIEVTTNPHLIDSVGSTSVQEIRIKKGTLPEFIPTWIDVYVKLPSTNSGTVQFNTYSNVMYNSPSYAAGTSFFMRVPRGKFWFKLSNANDTIEIVW